MKLDDLKKKNLPDTPGVYFFLDKEGKILYIGKATSLKNRVKSYFNKDVIDTRGPLIVDMVFRANDIEWSETDSVLEALLLEANLIKKYQPIFNVKEKDNKSYNFVVITKEEFPRVILERSRNILQKENLPYKIDCVYGPFPQGGILREAMKIIRRIFPYRDTCVPLPLAKGKEKVCFNAQIGLCPGVCSGKISKEEYKETIKQLKLFFEAKKKELLRLIKKEMNESAKDQNFEKAEILKKRFFALEHIQDVSLIKNENILRDPFGAYRIESFDIAHMSGKSIVGVMTVVTSGVVDKSEYRKFRIRTIQNANDTGAIREMLLRRFKHLEWGMPNLIVIDGGLAQKNVAEKVLRDLKADIPVVSVVKNEYHRPKKILGDEKIINEHEGSILLANSEAHRFGISYYRSLQRKDFLKGV